jgi:hypothetical protein
VKNRSDDPFEDTDIPPFDASEESVADAVFRDGRQKANQKNKNKNGNGRANSAQGKKPSGSGRGSARREESLPGSRAADIFYFLQPYVIFVLGVFLAIEMLLSCLMSGGSYDWTRDTQPFRWLGYYLEYFLFGLLGYGAYLLPAGMMYLAFDRLRYGKRRTGKGIMASCIAVLLPVIVHVCMISGDPQGTIATANIGVLYTTGAAHASGGVLPGLIGYLSYIGLGVIGTLIIGILAKLLGVRESQHHMAFVVIFVVQVMLAENEVIQRKATVKVKGLFKKFGIVFHFKANENADLAAVFLPQRLQGGYIVFQLFRAHADAVGKAFAAQFAIDDGGNDEDEHLQKDDAHCLASAIQQMPIDGAREQEQQIGAKHQERWQMQGLDLPLAAKECAQGGWKLL